MRPLPSINVIAQMESWGLQESEHRGEKKSIRGRVIVFFCNTGGYGAAGTNLAAVHCAEERAGDSGGKDGDRISKEGTNEPR